jgi:hypothetical protein
MTAALIAFHPWSSSQASMTTIDPTIGPAPPTEKPEPKPQTKPQTDLQTPEQTKPQTNLQTPNVNVEPKATAPEPAALEIISRPPGAHVIIDGHDLPKTAPARFQSLSPGAHRVLVERKGYLPRDLTVQLNAGEHRTLDVVLRAGQARGHVAPRVPSGFLTVRTVPWSKVFEGSRLLGTTPLANVHLSEGAHALTFVNPDLPPVHKTVTVRAGEESRLSFELKK